MTTSLDAITRVLGAVALTPGMPGDMRAILCFTPRGDCCTQSAQQWGFYPLLPGFRQFLDDVLSR